MHPLCSCRIAQSLDCCREHMVCAQTECTPKTESSALQHGDIGNFLLIPRARLGSNLAQDFQPCGWRDCSLTVRLKTPAPLTVATRQNAERHLRTRLPGMTFATPSHMANWTRQLLTNSDRLTPSFSWTPNTANPPLGHIPRGGFVYSGSLKSYCLLFISRPSTS